jgi:hypothetical protein
MYIQQEESMSTQRLRLDNSTKPINSQTLWPEGVQGLYKSTCYQRAGLNDSTVDCSKQFHRFRLKILFEMTVVISSDDTVTAN